MPHLRGVYLWRIEAFREWGQRALATIRALRRTFAGAGNLEWRALAAQQFIENNMDPEGLVAQLRTHAAAEELNPKT